MDTQKMSPGVDPGLFHVRQRDLIPEDALLTPVTIIGCGAVGSMLTIALTKMGMPQVTVIDFDKVDNENMNCQWFGPGDIGRSKAEALCGRVTEMSGLPCEGHDGLYEGQAFSGVVVSAVDNMKTRREIYEGQVKGYGSCRLLIDPRMAAEQALIYTVNPNNEEQRIIYEKTLYSDDEAVFEKCTAKSTMYTAMLLSGMVCKVIKDFITGVPHPKTVQWHIGKNDMEIFT